MRNRQINLALWSIAGLCAAAGMGTLLALTLLPLDLSATDDASQNHSPPTPRKAADASIAELSLAGRTFRTDHTAGAVPATETASPTNDLSAVKLVGTIGDSLAMLRGPDGTTAIVEVGDDVNGAAVVAIRPLQIDLKLNGRKTTLVKSDVSDDNAADPNAAAWPNQP